MILNDEHFQDIIGLKNQSNNKPLKVEKNKNHLINIISLFFSLYITSFFLNIGYNFIFPQIELYLESLNLLNNIKLLLFPFIQIFLTIFIFIRIGNIVAFFNKFVLAILKKVIDILK